MHFFLVIFVMVEILSSEFTTAKPSRTDLDLLNHADTEEPQQVIEDPDIEEIANREYETVHGRILAVNMAHLEKRKEALRDQETQTKGTLNDTNVFENIEKDNEAHHIEGLYQGDIIVDEDLEELLHLPKQTRTKRNAYRSRQRLWISRRIPYTIPSNMMHIRKNLLIAIAEYHKHTCLRFVPYRPGIHRNYITFSSHNGCASRIGKKYFAPGRQTVSLASGCNFPGTIIHELLHSIGFWHEQSRADRDKYVSIKWENIVKGFEDQFEKYSWRDLDQLNIDYDYQSIMHYGRTAFGNGKPTIVAIGNENMKFGTKNQRLSTKDIMEINALYDCQTTRYGWTKWSEFTPCDTSCYKSRQRYCYHSGNPKSCGGNVNAYGVEKDKRKCSEMECRAKNAIHGHWGHWGAWTTCSATCDDGARSRTRLCNNPAPSKFGRPCKGKAKEEELCTVGRCHLGDDDTEFESASRPFGMWKNKHGTKLTWIRHQFATPTMNTGTKYDHTKGTGAKGHYLYMESSYPAKPGDQAILKSPNLRTKTEFKCLKFYYTMYGDTMGSLEARLYRPGLPRKTVFYKRGNQGKPWHLGTATIEAKTTFALEIVGTVGKTGYSDIVIDDVYIDDGKCSCQNKYQRCKKWSAKGECKINEAWMKKNCPRSCVCGPGAKECKDSNTVQCPLWAKKGECEKNKISMEKHCPRSCKVCKPGAKECKDSNKVQCPLWAKNGECEKNKISMEKHCPRSCKVCKPPCKDKHKDCPKWALKSECTMKNKKWMLENCEKSCNVCVCADNNPQCSKWAGIGECKANPLYMDVNCKKSCNKCSNVRLV